MHPVLSIGIYILFEFLCFLQVRYCLKSFRPLSEKKPLWRTVAAAVSVITALLVLLPVAGALLPDSSLKFSLQAAGNIWLGFSIYFHGTLLLLSAVTSLAGCFLHRNNKRILPVLLTVSFLCGAGILLYGTSHARDTILTEYDVTIDKDAGTCKDLKIALIADLHISVNSRLSSIRKMVDAVNAQNPDVILIAGDIFTSTYEGVKQPEEYAAVLREMHAAYGTYAVYGNHDVEETLFGGFPISPISEAFRTQQMEAFFRDAGFTVLYDEMVTIADGEVQVFGRIDGEKAGDGTTNRKPPAELLKEADLAKPVIVLQHEPVQFAALKESGADLALCGHTHAGQIFPGNLIVPFFNENAYGLKTVSDLLTVVTSGVGFYGPPMRVGTNSEITVVNVHFG